MLDYRILLKNRTRSYRHIFGRGKVTDEFTNGACITVLADLRNFCNATKTTFSTDALTMARMEGRREVYSRITNHLNIDTAEHYNFHEEANTTDSNLLY